MRKKRILICDDDVELLEMTEAVLELDGFDIVCEKDSRNFFTTLEASSPDCILLDLWMPSVTGDQLLESLKMEEATAAIPVIVFSASTDGEKRAMLSGADAYLSKPFDIEQLGRLIHSITEMKKAG